MMEKNDQLRTLWGKNKENIVKVEFNDAGAIVPRGGNHLKKKTTYFYDTQVQLKQDIQNGVIYFKGDTVKSRRCLCVYAADETKQSYKINNTESPKSFVRSYCLNKSEFGHFMYGMSEKITTADTMRYQPLALTNGKVSRSNASTQRPEKKIVCNLGMIALSSDSIFYNLEENNVFLQNIYYQRNLMRKNKPLREIIIRFVPDTAGYTSINSQLRDQVKTHTV